MQAVIEDVEKNGFCFTDGCGQISSEMLSGVLISMRARLRPFEADGDVSAIQVGAGRFPIAEYVLWEHRGWPD